MKQLNKIESIIMVVGALLMVVGAVMGLFKLSWFPFVYAVGAACRCCSDMRAGT